MFRIYFYPYFFVHTLRKRNNGKSRASQRGATPQQSQR